MSAGRNDRGENSICDPDRLCLTSSASAQAVKATIKRGGEIVTQPARDVGAAKTKIPPVLEAAHGDPYGLAGLAQCRQFQQAINELNDVLGPDYAVGSEKKENRAGKLAEAAGKTVVNTIIPFRGLVREITGAAPAQRRLNAATSSSAARTAKAASESPVRGPRRYVGSAMSPTQPRRGATFNIRQAPSLRRPRCARVSAAMMA